VTSRSSVAHWPFCENGQLRQLPLINLPTRSSCTKSVLVRHHLLTQTTITTLTWSRRPHFNRRKASKATHITNTMIFRNCALVLLLCATADAFSPSKVPAPFAVRATTARTTRTTSSLLVLSAEEKKKGGLDGSLRNKLVSESIAPWRTLRLFLYGSAASGAFVGGLINGSGAIAGMNSPEFNLNTEVSFSTVG
jgi:hypothetical protein